jgi:hypothetical protein
VTRRQAVVVVVDALDARRQRIGAIDEGALVVEQPMQRIARFRWERGGGGQGERQQGSDGQDLHRSGSPVIGMR